MGRYASDQNQTILIHESGTYATTSGGGIWIGQVLSHEPTDSENYEELRYSGQGTRNVGQLQPTVRDYEGNLVFRPQDWRMLGFALGSMVDGGSPSPYTHTASELNSNQLNGFTSGLLNPFTSFAIEDAQRSAGGAGTNFTRTYRGCNVDSFELRASEDSPVAEVEVAYRAKERIYGSGAATAVTAATTRPFLWKDFAFHVPSGTVLDEVKSARFRIENNLQGEHYLNGSRDIAVNTPGDRKYELELTIHPTEAKNKTFFDQYFVGGSEFNMLIPVRDSEAGAGSRDMFLTLSGCKLVQLEAPSPQEGVNEQTLTIQATSASAAVDDLIFKYAAW